MRRVFFILYSLITYSVFFGLLLYALAFIGNLGVTNSIDGNPKMPLVPALLINGSLFLLLAVQRNVFAKSASRRWWKKLIPGDFERHTQLLLTSLFLLLIMWQWQPIGGVVWEISNEKVKMVLLITYLVGWIIVFTSAFLFNYLDFFGQKLPWLKFRSKRFEHSATRIVFFYRFVRHSLFFGLLIILWSAPIMTVAHLFLAMLTALYILTSIQLAERNLTIN